MQILQTRPGLQCILETATRAAINYALQPWQKELWKYVNSYVVTLSGKNMDMVPLQTAPLHRKHNK